MSEEEYWLIKVPNFVLEEWEKQKSAPAGTVLGQICVATHQRRDSAGKPEMKLKVTAMNSAIPTDSIMQVKEIPTQMLVFQEKMGTEKMRKLGPVKSIVDVKQELSDSYRQIVQTRTLHDHVKVSSTQHLADISQGTLTTAATLNAVYDKAAKRKREERKDPKYRRVRLERDALDNIIFRLFDKQTHYNLKDLRTATEQPDSYLKEVLNDLCEYHQTGQYRFMYSLKQGYQTIEEAYTIAQHNAQ